MFIYKPLTHPFNMIKTLKNKKKVKCVQVKDGPIECSFTQSNLLFGKYELTTNYDDVFCWKPQAAGAAATAHKTPIVINIDSESQMVRVEQLGFRLNLKLSHGGVTLKLVDASRPEHVLYSRNILAESTAELSNLVCLPQIASYRLLIDSCHKFTPNEPDSLDITPKLFSKGENNVNLVAFKHRLDAIVSFKLLDLKDPTFLKARLIQNLC